jgi:3-dehydroquinate synthase
MAVIRLDLPGREHGYDVVVEPGGLPGLGERVRAVASHERAAVLIDEAVETEHGRPAARSMQDAGFDTAVGVVSFGEKRKTLGLVQNLYSVLLDHQLERKSPVVAVGGGVCGDVVGFTAASYQRGLPWVQVPTTLLAMVDASVGGKTGVNLPQGKNLVGAFHQPQLVLIDPLTLTTLPARQLRCGLAECVKHAVIRDAELFDWTREHAERLLGLDVPVVSELIERNVAIKAAVVMADEREAGERAHLNFGHTFGHAIESTVGYGVIHHGEAVSLGMVAAAALSAKLGICGEDVVERLVSLLETLGLPTSSGKLADPRVLLAAMQKDKKVQSGKLRLIVPERIGAVRIIDDAPAAAIVEAWGAVRG